MGAGDRVKQFGRTDQPWATSGLCRLAVRTITVTPLMQRLFWRIQFGRATASPRRFRHMPSEMRMQECGLHAHFDAQAAMSSGATWGSLPNLRRICGHKTGAPTPQKGVRCGRPSMDLRQGAMHTP